MLENSREELPRSLLNPSSSFLRALLQGAWGESETVSQALADWLTCSTEHLPNPLVLHLDFTWFLTLYGTQYTSYLDAAV